MKENLTDKHMSCSNDCSTTERYEGPSVSWRSVYCNLLHD